MRSLGHTAVLGRGQEARLAAILQRGVALERLAVQLAERDAEEGVETDAGSASGVSDARLAAAAGLSEAEVRQRRCNKAQAKDLLMQYNIRCGGRGTGDSCCWRGGGRCGGGCFCGSVEGAGGGWAAAPPRGPQPSALLLRTGCSWFSLFFPFHLFQPPQAGHQHCQALRVQRHRRGRPGAGCGPRLLGWLFLFCCFFSGCLVCQFSCCAAGGLPRRPAAAAAAPRRAPPAHRAPAPPNNNRPPCRGHDGALQVARPLRARQGL